MYVRSPHDGDSLEFDVAEGTMCEGTQKSREPLFDGGICEEKARLEMEYVKAIHDQIALHTRQTQAVIEGDPAFTRFDVLLHMGNERKEQAKYALIAHIEVHQCGTEP